ncbi:MAG: hypothetical protein AAFZ65_01875 [Planctomycetota bacterium]
MSEAEAASGAEVDLDALTVETVLRRIAEDVSLVVDRTFSVDKLESSRQDKRVAGKGKVHISFKLEINQGGRADYGCVLVPLPDAIALACYLMMVPDDAVKQRRNAKDLDKATKDALVEVDNFIGGATDGALRGIAQEVSARGAGCQGVRADVRPAFPYEEGQPLLVGSAEAQLHDLPAFRMILMLPVIENIQLDE